MKRLFLRAPSLRRPNPFAFHERKQMKTIAAMLVQIVSTVLAAEFVAGLVHWFEDAYVREDTPLIGRFVGRPNTIHHHFPRYMTRHGWWQSSWDLALLAAILVVASWRLD